MSNLIFCFLCDEPKSSEDYPSAHLNNRYPRCKTCEELSKTQIIDKNCIKNLIRKEKKEISRRIKDSLKCRGFNKTGLAQEYLGVSRSDFISHISSLFREGMSWENRGEWHLDHVMPLSTAETSEDIKRLWHYTNLQPLWKSENEQKSNLLDWRDRFEWAKEVVDIRRRNGLE